jgi:ubiquinone/menaquinone biosynthesis C-methylase UbiE
MESNIPSAHHHVHQHSPERLETPERVHELNPAATLAKIGFTAGQVLCDIGAGSGLFTLPAAHITQQTVYALDVNPAMIAAVQAKAKAADLANIDLRKVEGQHLPVPDDSVDLALVATVLHEIPQKGPFIREIQRLLKPDGRLAVIEFHGKATPMGPPSSERLGQDVVIALMEAHDFSVIDQFDLGPNLYCVVFRKA